MTSIAFKGKASDLQKLFRRDPIVTHADLEDMHENIRSLETVLEQIRMDAKLGNVERALSTLYSLDIYLGNIKREVEHHLDA